MVVVSKEWLDHEAEDIKRAKGLTMSEQVANHVNANENPQTNINAASETTPSQIPTDSISAIEQNEAESQPLLYEDNADEPQDPAPTHQKEFDDQQKKTVQQQLLAQQQQREQQQRDLLLAKQQHQIQQSPTPLPTPQSTPIQTPLPSPLQSPQTTLKPQTARTTPKSMTSPKNSASSTNIDTNKGVRVFLICQPNSHPFTNRNIVLEPNQEVKVGRFITRNKISDNNAIFDCKVLSRNHALIWLSDGKYYIRDTASSNGTFVNNQRLSLTGVLSKPFEVNTGDVVQFGVDVLENSRKETHGCIVALLNFCSLDSPDTKGLKTDELMKKSMMMQSLPAGDLYRLNTYVQETIQRDNNLETTMLNLQKVVESTRRNSAITWHAMIEEDRLLSRIDILENKLQYFQKNMTADKLRNETIKLQEDKAVYQSSAKEALRKVYQERTEAITKLCTIERALCNSEEECSLLRDQLLTTQQNFQDVTSMLSEVEEKTRNQHQQEIQDLNKMHVLELGIAKDLMEGLLKEKNDLLERVELYERFASQVSDEDEPNHKLAWSNNKVHSWMTKLEKDVYTSIYNKKDDPNVDADEPAPSAERAALADIEKHIKQLENLQGQLSKAQTKNDSVGNDNTSDGLVVASANTDCETLPNENHKPAEQVSDGNQNNTECPLENGQLTMSVATDSDSELVKEMSTHLMEAYFKFRGQLVQLLKNQEKPRVPKNLFDDVESQLACSQLEVHSLQRELLARPSTADFDTLVTECDQLRAKVNADSDIAETQTDDTHIHGDTAEVFQRNTNDPSDDQHLERDRLLTQKTNAVTADATTLGLDSVRTQPDMHDKGTEAITLQTSDSASQTDLTANVEAVVIDEPTILGSSKSVKCTASDDHEDVLDELITAGDIAMLNDPDVQREEELVAFKEECARLLEHNSLMKNEISDLQTRLRNGTPIWTMLIYVMPIVAFIGYIISPYL